MFNLKIKGHLCLGTTFILYIYLYIEYMYTHTGI